MTIEEMFQYLINEIKQLKEGQARLETKVDANHKELSEKIDANYKEFSGKIDANYKELSGKIDANYTKMLDSNLNLRFEILNLGDKVERLSTNFKNNRRIIQSTLNDFQVRLEQTEDDLAIVKDRIEKAS